ncbi:hydrogenase/urease maturation nickel metallochaperone HypA, partial [Mycobacterium tuberculosis]
MHEITLSQRALEIIEQQAQQAGARRVTGVWLKVGAFSCVEASALTFCFE